MLSMPVMMGGWAHAASCVLAALFLLLSVGACKAKPVVQNNVCECTAVTRYCARVISPFPHQAIYEVR